MSPDEANAADEVGAAVDVEIDQDEIDQAEIDEIKAHAQNPLEPRSVLHFFGAQTRESAKACADSLNEKYAALGGAASFTGAEIDLTDPDSFSDPDAAPFQLVFEHEAVVDDAYLKTVHDMEAIAQRTGVEYAGWEADDGTGLV